MNKYPNPKAQTYNELNLYSNDVAGQTLLEFNTNKIGQGPMRNH